MDERLGELLRQFIAGKVLDNVTLRDVKQHVRRQLGNDADWEAAKPRIRDVLADVMAEEEGGDADAANSNDHHDASQSESKKKEEEKEDDEDDDSEGEQVAGLSSHSTPSPPPAKRARTKKSVSNATAKRVAGRKGRSAQKNGGDDEELKRLLKRTRELGLSAPIARFRHARDAAEKCEQLRDFLASKGAPRRAEAMSTAQVARFRANVERQKELEGIDTANILDEPSAENPRRRRAAAMRASRTLVDDDEQEEDSGDESDGDRRGDGDDEQKDGGAPKGSATEATGEEGGDDVEDDGNEQDDDEDEESDFEPSDGDE